MIFKFILKVRDEILTQIFLEKKVDLRHPLFCLDSHRQNTSGDFQFPFYEHEENKDFTAENFWNCLTNETVVAL